MALKVGDKLYRVVDDGDSLRVQAVEIAVAGAKSFKLKRPFVGVMGVQFKLGALDLLFDMTEVDALRRFARRMEREIEQSKFHIKQSEEFLAWANHALSRRG